MPSVEQLLVLVFALVPGFVADQAFRACWGLDAGDQTDRVLRALVWTVFGLALYAAVAGVAPAYVTAVLPAGARGPAGRGLAAALPPAAFDRWTLAALALHTLAATAAAVAAGALTSTGPLPHYVSAWFRRSLRDESPWDALWRHEAAGRTVLVERTDGRVYAGALLRASTGRDAAHQLALQNPLLLGADGAWTALADTRLLYLPESAIRELRFSKTRGELDAERREVAASPDRVPASSPPSPPAGVAAV